MIHYRTIAFVLAAALPAQQHGIGTKGATVRFDAGWKRQKMDPDLGEDQFQFAERKGAEAEVCCLIREVSTALEHETDYRRVMQLLSAVGHDQPIEVTREAGWTRASRRVDTTVDGIRCTFQLDLLAQPGLGYFLMTWAGQSRKALLDKNVAVIRAGFRFPGPGSSWQKGLEHKRHVCRLAGFELSLEARPSVLREQGQEAPVLLGLRTEDEEHCAFVLERANLNSPDAVLTETFRNVAESTTGLVEVSRGDFELTGGKGRRLVAKTASHTYHLAAIPLPGNRHFDVRYVSPGQPEVAREDRDRLFRSLQLHRPASKLTLPEPRKTAKVKALDPSRTSFLALTQEIASSDSGGHRGVRQLPDGRWLLMDWRELQVLARGQPPETIYEGEQFGIGGAFRWREQWFVIERDVVYEVRDGARQPAEICRARCVQPIGDALLLVRPSPRAALPGLPAGNDDLLVRRDAAGKETTIATLRGLWVRSLQVDAQNRQLLLEASRDDVLGNAAVAALLWHVDLDQGTAREFGAWDEVVSLAGAETGWLVTGRPRGRPAGIWHVRSADDLVALVTGPDVRGLGLQGGRLVFASSLGRADGIALREVAVTDCTKAGASCQPFAATQLNTIGQRLVAARGEAVPRSEADVRACLAKANELARELCGAALPVSLPGVDALFETVQGSDLASDGRILLGLLFASALLDGNAVWVDAASATWTSWCSRSPQVPDTAFVVSHTPGEVLASSLDDTEGLGPPCVTLRELADGRTMLLGLDAERLRERVAAAEPAGIRAALQKGDVAVLRAEFIRLKDNVHLRRRVYSGLAALDHLRAVEELAQPFASATGADIADVTAWFAAWSQRVQDAASAVKLIEAATAALGQHPDAAHLYLYLGKAYELAKAGEPEYARTCYERVVELQQWGDAGEAAKAGLERLQKK